MALYKASEWQDANGRWHVGNLTAVGKGSNYWWYPLRLLNMQVEEYINMLVNEYKVDHVCYSEAPNVLMFSWDNNNYANAHKYMLWINRMARNKNLQLNL